MKIICNLAVIPMRKESSDKSEMTSQLLFGETATVIEHSDKWVLIETDHDHYQGWVDKKQIEAYQSIDGYDKMICTAPLLIAKNAYNGYVFIPAGSVIYSDNEKRIICGSRVFTCNEGELMNATAKADLALAALVFLDTPYLWGGRTMMGIDCSGFTQLIYRIAGHQIPRDAYQQAEIGESIAFIDEAITGDLAFFDNAEGRITHVGMIIKQDTGDKAIIHASGKVRMDRLDHQGIYNLDNNEYSHNLRIIKRIIQ